MSDLNEAEIVCAIESGDREVDVTAQYGITFEELDEIMEAHDFTKCSNCETWYFSADEDICPDCGMDP